MEGVRGESKPSPHGGSSHFDLRVNGFWIVWGSFGEHFGIVFGEHHYIIIPLTPLGRSRGSFFLLQPTTTRSYGSRAQTSQG